MKAPRPKLNLLTLHKTPYGWPLRQLKIPQAHRITKGRPDVVVAVIDLGYSYHPDHRRHLWVNPHPTKGDVHGWDAHDNDASLEYNLYDPESTYHKGHHAFIVGEIIACAPKCKVMIVRVGYGNPDSWWKGIDYAVDHGARILVIPHGFLTHGRDSPIPLFYRGTDFGCSIDNPKIRRSLDRAYDAGCLVFKGTADNRGRRVAYAESGLESVVAVGSTNSMGKPADICASADYVEVAAPGGQRSSKDEREHCWSTGGNQDYIPFTGGCMASGFAGGVAALVIARFPQLTNEQVRQILRNTASNEQWDSKLGWGILDAQKAVSLKTEQLVQKPQIEPSSVKLSGRTLTLTVVNRGVFDIQRVLVMAFNGDPLKPAAPQGTLEKPLTLVTRQIGHALAAIRGLHGSQMKIELVEKPKGPVWLQICTLDRHGSEQVQTLRMP